MNILGLETSCDETSAAVVADGREVLANIVASQIDRHAPYGGVIPELAAREHLRAVAPIVQAALTEARLTIDRIDAVAVTATPGLLPALLVGVAYAKGLAAARGLPLIGVDHLCGHIYGALLEQPEVVADATAYPLLALVVSGGHTLLITIAADGRCAIVGRTLDDAAGEAFDKAAKILHLGYPGGPVIDQLARRGNAKSYRFPQGLTGRGGVPLKPENRLNFSFSGVKTSLLHHAEAELTTYQQAILDGEAPSAADLQLLADTAASYQESIVAVLTAKFFAAATQYSARTMILCGGVACNSRLRASILKRAQKTGLRLLIAPPAYCLDNAAMIAGLAYHQLRRGETSALDLDAAPRHRVPERLPFAPLAGA